MSPTAERPGPLDSASARGERGAEEAPTLLTVPLGGPERAVPGSRTQRPVGRGRSGRRRAWGGGAGGWGVVSPRTAAVGSAELLYDAVKGPVCAGASAGGRRGGARAVIPENGRLGARVSAGPDTGAVPQQGTRWFWLAHVHWDSSVDGHMLRGTRLTMGTHLCLRIKCTYVRLSQATNPPGHTFRGTGTRLLSGYTLVGTQGPTRDIVLTHFHVPRVPGIMSTVWLSPFPKCKHLQTLTHQATSPPVTPIADLKATLFSFGLYMNHKM